MLPIFEAIDIISVIPKNVGHTQPWVVVAKTPSGIKSYVVKMYTTEQINRNNSVTAEVISNKLASEFNLSVPSAAYIDIPESLLINQPPEIQELFDKADSRLKFATELLPNVNAAMADMTAKFYKPRIGMDSLYAFDNLILNADRGVQKVNLLIDSNTAWLIDHEYSFDTNEMQNILDKFNINPKFTTHHLFHKHLKKATRKSKVHYFDEFTECLKTLNINSLGNYFTQLEQIGYNSNKKIITNWLELVKKKSPTFVDSLKGAIG